MAGHQMTVAEARDRRRCDNCIHRKRGPGPLECLHPHANEQKLCPGCELPGEE